MKNPILFILFCLLALQTQAQELAVMTYNIRLNNAGDGENAWPVRRDYLVSQIKFYGPDVFGVQEALPEQMDYLRKEFPDYKSLGDGREGPNKGEYSAIFYNTKKLKLEQGDMFWLSTTPGKVSTGWDAALPRVCTYGLFSVEDSGRKFWMFNTHFDHVGQQARVNSAQLILGKIKEMDTENYPVVLTGDFNVEPDNPVYPTITKEMLDAHEVSELPAFGPKGTFNGFKYDEPVTRRIDYIFVSKSGFIALKEGILTDSKDSKYPSDHFPVLAYLQFEKNQATAAMKTSQTPVFYLEGHRGTRGNMPENTIPAMIKGVDLGANTLEMDVHITKDGQVVVAHDPTLNPNITLTENGDPIPSADAKKYVLHQMDYDQIKMFDVGSKGNKSFPQQKKEKTHMPLLKDLIAAVENHVKENGLKPIIYDIEIKTQNGKDGIYQLAPPAFVKKVMEVVNKADINDRYYLQSFDKLILKEVHKSFPAVTIGFLTGNKKASLETNIEELGFKPEIYSPHFSMATPELVNAVQEKGMKFIPWTVNNPKDVKAMLKVGIDGIITDFPGRVKAILEKRK